MSDLSPNVALVDGIPCVSSLEVAQRFGKLHNDILKSIRAIMAECPEYIREGNFSLTFRYVPGPNGARRRSPAYNLTRDAFSLVVMGFTGKEALRWKIRYIEAFNAMEKALAEKAAKPKRKALPSAPLPRPALPQDDGLPPDALDAMTDRQRARRFRRLMEEVRGLAQKVGSTMDMVRFTTHPGARYVRIAPQLDARYNALDQMHKIAVAGLYQAEHMLYCLYFLGEGVEFR